MGGTEDQVQDSTDGADGAEPAAHPEVAAPGPQSCLTFHPARDDPVRLRSFLDSVTTQYLRQTNPQASHSSHSDES